MCSWAAELPGDESCPHVWVYCEKPPASPEHYHRRCEGCGRGECVPISIGPALMVSRSMLDSPALEENKALRRMLFAAHGFGYSDDGEMQNSKEFPAIDFKRDSAEVIEQKLRVRGERRLREASKS